MDVMNIATHWKMACVGSGVAGQFPQLCASRAVKREPSANLGPPGDTVLVLPQQRYCRTALVCYYLCTFRTLHRTEKCVLV